MMLCEWFEDYHEWHFSKDPDVEDHKICIWDSLHGNRFASPEQSFSILRQIARILTLYYDPETFRQIYPWHHAAGDFIIKTGKDSVDVKLTTARKYESFMEVFSDGKGKSRHRHPLFFHESDHPNSPGQAGWRGGNILGRGFFGRWRPQQAFLMPSIAWSSPAGCPLGHGKDLLFLLKSFTFDELERLFESLLVLYHRDDPAEFEMIRMNLKSHVALVHRTLQEFSPEALPRES